jgi:hypothetical protein
MFTLIRKWILRANALWLLPASIGGLSMDILGAFYGLPPQALILRDAPEAAIGFIEAHGLALVLALHLWRAAPTRSWHLTGAAVGALLGTANLVFWQIFIKGDMLAVGYITTTMHWLFFALEVFAAVALSATSDRGRVLRAPSTV